MVVEKLKILILGDSFKNGGLLDNYLLKSGCDVYKSLDISEGVNILSQEGIDIVFLFMAPENSASIELIRKLKSLNSLMTLVIIVNQESDSKDLYDAYLAGADGLLLKPFNLKQLKKTLERIRPFAEFQKKYTENDLQYKRICSDLYRKTKLEIVGTSPAIKEVINLVDKVAGSDSTTVLITGESGTGKELIARSIHALSKRSRQFFHSVNCASIPENLFESEFFGHKKGAFTGAVESTPGWFEISQNGSLFLDEVSELPLNMQSKFLRALENKMISKIGERKHINIDVRIIVATNQNLENMVADNEFRPDLYYRISPFTINIPPLRLRKEDVPELINYYTAYFSRKLGKNIENIEDNVYDKMLNYDFPGNVRELKNIIERATIICDDSTIRAQHIKLFNRDSSMFIPGDGLNLQSVEKTAIKKALLRCNYNKTRAAKVLDISRQALDRKIKKYSIIQD